MSDTPDQTDQIGCAILIAVAILCGTAYEIAKLFAK